LVSYTNKSLSTRVELNTRVWFSKHIHARWLSQWKCVSQANRCRSKKKKWHLQKNSRVGSVLASFTF